MKRQLPDNLSFVEPTSTPAVTFSDIPFDALKTTLSFVPIHYYWIASQTCKTFHAAISDLWKDVKSEWNTELEIEDEKIVIQQVRDLNTEDQFLKIITELKLKHLELVVGTPITSNLVTKFMCTQTPTSLMYKNATGATALVRTHKIMSTALDRTHKVMSTGNLETTLEIKDTQKYETNLSHFFRNNLLPLLHYELFCTMVFELDDLHHLQTTPIAKKLISKSKETSAYVISRQTKALCKWLLDSKAVTMETFCNCEIYYCDVPQMEGHNMCTKKKIHPEDIDFRALDKSKEVYCPWYFYVSRRLKCRDVDNNCISDLQTPTNNDVSPINFYGSFKDILENSVPIISDNKNIIISRYNSCSLTYKLHGRNLSVDYVDLLMKAIKTQYLNCALLVLDILFDKRILRLYFSVYENTNLRNYGRRLVRWFIANALKIVKLLPTVFEYFFTNLQNYLPHKASSNNNKFLPYFVEKCTSLFDEWYFYVFETILKACVQPSDCYTTVTPIITKLFRNCDTGRDIVDRKYALANFKKIVNVSVSYLPSDCKLQFLRSTCEGLIRDYYTFYPGNMMNTRERFRVIVQILKTCSSEQQFEMFVEANNFFMGDGGGTDRDLHGGQEHVEFMYGLCPSILKKKNLVINHRNFVKWSQESIEWLSKQQYVCPKTGSIVRYRFSKQEIEELVYDLYKKDTHEPSQKYTILRKIYAMVRTDCSLYPEDYGRLCTATYDCTTYTGDIDWDIPGLFPDNTTMLIMSMKALIRITLYANREIFKFPDGKYYNDASSDEIWTMKSEHRVCPKESDYFKKQSILNLVIQKLDVDKPKF